MTSKYGFKPDCDSARAKKAREFFMEEMYRIDSIVRDILTDYRHTKGIEGEMKGHIKDDTPSASWYIEGAYRVSVFVSLKDRTLSLYCDIEKPGARKDRDTYRLGRTIIEQTQILRRWKKRVKGGNIDSSFAGINRLFAFVRGR